MNDSYFDAAHPSHRPRIFGATFIKELLALGRRYTPKTISFEPPPSSPALSIADALSSLRPAQSKN